MNIAVEIATELQVQPQQVEAAIALLDEGATVPFIARYRKEVTGSLDDTQLRQLEERLGYLRELVARRAVVLAAIDEQGKLTPALQAAIEAADTKTRLEDLYRPYMKKRRTKAQIAREAGLAPLAEGLLSDPTQMPTALAATFVDADKGVADSAAALDGARQILMEQFAEDADLVGKLREHLWQSADLVSTLVEGKGEEGAKFADYFDFREPLRQLPSHRALALYRGSKEGILTLSLELPADAVVASSSDPREAERIIAAHYRLQDQGRAADRWLLDTVRWAWRVKIQTHLDTDLKGQRREVAEDEAIRVFADNLKDLLLAAPAGQRPTMGIDPGLRTGIKVALVDGTGKLLETATLYPHVPKNQWSQSIAALAALAAKYQIELVAIGNGTASRETDRLVAELMARHPELRLTRVLVSEAGASVYSASALAAEEFPDLDVSLRGAVSIARRLQDPLAELVKIEPKSIGVGQYQHDVSQLKLARMLGAVVEDCVNAVGVDLNTASAPLLAQVAGLTPGLASNIVAHRDAHGPFQDRQQLLAVTRLGPKAFEQAAGFLRILDGHNPLDGSAVHPEAYPVVQRISDVTGRPVASLIGNSEFLRTLVPANFTDAQFGEPTVRDILHELEKPGRDPRPAFRTATFKEGVEQLSDLKPGMVLEGSVTNVTQFGAFVDLGVHQDGLVHISALADRFVKDPREVVKTGDVVKVKVMSVDLLRKRIGLTMRLHDPLPEADSGSDGAKGGRARSERGDPRVGQRAGTGRRGAAVGERRGSAGVASGALNNSAMADALAQLKRGR